jgi:hypothetical protein
MPKPVDFRLIKPIKKFNDFTKEVEYEIPCMVIKIGEEISKNKYAIEVEHLDFATGKKVVNSGITYKKTIDLFNGFKRKPPFPTTCRVVKQKKNTFTLVVYGLFNVGLMEKFYNVSGILNHDEKQILDVFKSHHKELLEWLFEPTKENPSNTKDDLPF